MVVVQEERVRRSWEELIVEGQEARELGDNSNWKRGDLASEVSTSYGENSIGKYAYAIGTAKKTLMNYRTTASRFGKNVRKKYRKLSFSHFSALGATEKPEAWLEKADDGDWNVERLRKEVRDAYKDNKIPNIDDVPPKVYRCPECNLWRLKDTSSFDICRGHYTIKRGKIVYR